MFGLTGVLLLACTGGGSPSQQAHSPADKAACPDLDFWISAPDGVLTMLLYQRWIQVDGPGQLREEADATSEELNYLEEESSLNQRLELRGGHSGEHSVLAELPTAQGRERIVALTSVFDEINQRVRASDEVWVGFRSGGAADTAFPAVAIDGQGEVKFLGHCVDEALSEGFHQLYRQILTLDSPEIAGAESAGEVLRSLLNGEAANLAAELKWIHENGREIGPGSGFRGQRE